MKDIIPAKKQSPILGLTGMGGGVGSNLGGSLAEEAKYIDEVFSTYLYDGNSTTLSVNSGVDNTKGGMIWFKDRTGTETHLLFDSERGTSNYIQSNSTAAQTSGGAALTSFDDDGYTLGASAYQNNSGRRYVSWNFREKKGFFDIVTWTGNGTDPRQISHNLECVPGFVMIKCTSNAHGWACYHRDYSGKLLELNSTFVGNSSIWKNTTATDTYITVDNQQEVNGNGKTYVGYFFAGGESTAATARSVDFDRNGGNGECIFVADDPAWDIGSVDCTLECWVNFKAHNGHDGIFHNVGNSGWNGGGWIMEPVNGRFHFYYMNTGGNTGYVSGAKIPLGQWQHIAVTKSGSTIKIYQDGLLTGSGTINGTIRDGTNSLKIGGQCVGQDCDAFISNVRITIGQILYTSSFKPSTVPLTTTSQGATASNVKLLCCNNSSVTGSTVTTGTINSFGSPTASTDSPFDDPAGFVFGENEDQNLIKCGSYIGNGDVDGPKIHLGWQPSWVMIRRTNTTDNWVIWDSMRGIVTDGDDNALYPDLTQAEGVSPYLSLTSYGFKFNRSSGMVNSTGSTYSYMAIRSVDGYVGKPAKVGTDVFDMDAGGNTPLPCFVANFAADYAFTRDITSSAEMYSIARLLQKRFQVTSTSAAESTSNAFVFDYNLGCCGSGLNSTFQAWMWKRGAGFDVMTYKGTGASPRDIPHNLGRTPEMIWIKNRDNTNEWVVGHKGLNGGTNPWEYSMHLQNSDGQADTAWTWADTAPTSTHFTVHSDGYVNGGSQNYVAMLWSSVAGISKCGYYTGTGSNPTITTGFSPRFVLIKRTNTSGDWMTFDTVRGFSGSTDCYLKLNELDGQTCGTDWGYPTSDGFVISDNQQTGGNTSQYIYYAHA